jgi:DNA-binding response OmpR family regulator
MSEMVERTLQQALIIEDDPNLGEIFTEALRASGFAVEHIDDGRVAIDRLLMLRPRVIVLDLHLPNVSGETILAFIRAQPHLADTKVILATADAALADRIRADADLVLLKPISFNQLQSLAERLLPS